MAVKATFEANGDRMSACDDGKGPAGDSVVVSSVGGEDECSA